MTDPLIARLDALAQKSTPGPWASEHEDAHCPLQLIVASGTSVVADFDGMHNGNNDADFIAALVTAWPEIRARLEAGEQLAKAARNVYDHDDAFTETSPGHHSRDKALCAAIAAYDAANAKGTG